MLDAQIRRRITIGLDAPGLADVPVVLGAALRMFADDQRRVWAEPAQRLNAHIKAAESEADKRA